MLQVLRMLMQKAREGFREHPDEGETPVWMALLMVLLLSAVFLFLTSWLVATLWNITLVPLAGVKKATLLHGLLLKVLWMALLL